MFLVNYANNNFGRGIVFANNILCELYDICLEDEVMKAEEQKSRKAESGDNNQSKSAQSVLSEFQNKALENITLVPNPTSGELRIENIESKIEAIEIYDITGRKLSSLNPSPHHSLTTFNISHLQSGVYFVKITTETGEITKRIVKQ